MEDLTNITDEELRRVIQMVRTIDDVDLGQFQPIILRHRVCRFAALQGYESVSKLVEKLITDRSLIHIFLQKLTVPTTEMFRDAEFWTELEAIINDKALMKRIKTVNELFRAYMDVEPNKNRPSVAYFSMEYGMHSALKIYSGGLGMLAGDYLKEASDSNVDMCASVSSIASAISHRACRWKDSRLPTTSPKASPRCLLSASSTRTDSPWWSLFPTPTIRFTPTSGR